MAGSGDGAAKSGFTFRPLRLEDPDEIAGFRLVARLGSGGMGTVYLSHMRDGQPTALKVIRPELAEAPDFQHQFQREVASASRVTGPFLVPVLESDGDGPVPWLATTYIAGPSLGEATRTHGPLPAPIVVRLVAGVAEALRLIHQAGVVHRDLKPSNVLLAADGPRVIDFGIARAVDSTTIAASGRRLGTPGFMSPEQARGLQVAAPADIFSLGLLACFAVTGRGAFGRGEPDALLYRIVHDEPDLADCPDGLRDLIAACLTKDPVGRPSAEQVLEACRVLADGGSPIPGAGWLPAAVLADIESRGAPPPQAPSRPGWMPGSTAAPAAASGAVAAAAGVAGGFDAVPPQPDSGPAGPPDACVGPRRGPETPDVERTAPLSAGQSADWDEGRDPADYETDAGLDPDADPGLDADPDDIGSGPAAQGAAARFGQLGQGGGQVPYRGGFGPVIIHAAEPPPADGDTTIVRDTGGATPWAGGGATPTPPAAPPGPPLGPPPPDGADPETGAPQPGGPVPLAGSAPPLPPHGVGGLGPGGGAEYEPELDTPVVAGGGRERRGGGGRVAVAAALAVVLVLGAVGGGGYALGLFGGGTDDGRNVTDLASEEPPPSPDIVEPTVIEEDIDPDEAEESLSPPSPEPDDEKPEQEKAPEPETSATPDEPAPDRTPDPEPDPTPDPTRSTPSTPAPPPPGQPGRDNCSYGSDRGRTWADGMAGQSVRQIQCLLNHNYSNSLDVDGIFGGQTASAVRSVQRCSGIAVDGEVGPETWRYLDTPKRSCGN